MSGLNTHTGSIENPLYHKVSFCFLGHIIIKAQLAKNITSNQYWFKGVASLHNCLDR